LGDKMGRLIFLRLLDGFWHGPFFCSHDVMCQAERSNWSHIHEKSVRRRWF
jgi:hypothetical protein